MKYLRAVPKKRLLASALLMALGQPVLAQSATDGDQAAPQSASSQTAGSLAGNTTPPSVTELDRMEVVGIRGSLTSSANLKRDGQGVVDGIVAEDIGKFPDTNLAESLQRISGVSIDRSNNEGSRVTVRGVGPDYNLVLLNGRQMPTATGSRAFEFSDLASESVSEVDVYKTARASTPVGGIGATINILTARPLDKPGFHGSAGIKGVFDTSDDDLPGKYKGDSVTPEISGIVSDTFFDDRFGVSLSLSRQERQSGSASAFVAAGNGWREFIDTPQPNGEGGGSQLGLQPGEIVNNRPGPNDVYGIPQSVGYSINAVKRVRTNGQLTLQFAPTDNIKTTLDYTYSENKTQARSNDASVWFGFTPDVSTWTPGSGSSPLYYHETYREDPNTPGRYNDFANGASQSANVHENKSLGFNVEWQVNDAFKLNLDYHDSSAESRPDSPYGSSNVLSTAGFFRAGNGVDFNGEFPILTLDLPPGQTAIDPAQQLVTGSVFSNNFQRGEIKQFQASGEFQFENLSKLNFGVGTTDYKNRSAFTNVQLNTWGGATSVNDYPDEVFPVANFSNYFSEFGGAKDPNFTGDFFLWDFDTVRQLAADAWVRNNRGVAEDYQASFDYKGGAVPGTGADRSFGDSRVHEKSRSAYVEWSNTFDWRLPVNLNVGVRYENTKVDGEALQPVPVAINWSSVNEFVIAYAPNNDFFKRKGDYTYWLPNVDLSVDLRDDMKARFSYSQTIGRPNWSDLNPALGVGGQIRFDGGGGGSGDPNLKPLESDNYDLSYEWYYDEGSYVSLGYFYKKIDNFIANQSIRQTPFPDLTTPAGGAYWNQAIAAGGCGQVDLTCIRDYIFANFAGQPGVVVDPNSTTGGTITGLPGDPVAQFNVTQPVNNRADKLYGWEFNVQHLFSDSGFGVSTNYTYVKSGLSYDNSRLGTQFALTGLSDSANFVAFYDKNALQVRVAYNWRDQFLTGLGDGKGPNPLYVEPFSQIDAIVSYTFFDNLTLSLEGLNLTNETQRVHGRNSRQLYTLNQYGPRYTLGLRYNF